MRIIYVNVADYLRHANHRKRPNKCLTTFCVVDSHRGGGYISGVQPILSNSDDTFSAGVAERREHLTSFTAWMSLRIRGPFASETSVFNDTNDRDTKTLPPQYADMTRARALVRPKSLTSFRHARRSGHESLRCSRHPRNGGRPARVIGRYSGGRDQGNCRLTEHTVIADADRQNALVVYLV